jgi:hypothetical protein
VHAESGGGEHGVVDLLIHGAMLAGAVCVFCGDLLTACCTFPAIANSALSLSGIAADSKFSFTSLTSLSLTSPSFPPRP